MARINWKKKYEAMRYLAEAYRKRLIKNTTLAKSVSALKGQLTRTKKKLDPQTMYKELVDAARKLHNEDERRIRRLEQELTKSAKARELVELLEWAKETEYGFIEIYSTGKVKIYSNPYDTINRDSLLLALRAAKKAVEVGK
jgi:hypothetical protein